jgi:hypothetical protein
MSNRSIMLAPLLHPAPRSGEGGPPCAAGWWKGRLTQTSLGRTPPPPPFGWSPAPALRAGADKAKSFSRRTHAPELCPRPRCHLKQRFASGNQRGKRSAERRMPTMSTLRKQVYAVCATHLLRGCAPTTPSSHACGGESGRGRARLSALTLVALATGYHPDGPAPEPGFPPTSRAGVLPAWPFCRRLSTLRAGRSFCRPTGDPEPPGSGLAIPRGHRPSLPSFRLALPERRPTQ